MVLTISSLLIILAFICEFLAALNVVTSSRVNLVAAGLALWFLAMLIGRLPPA